MTEVGTGSGCQAAVMAHLTKAAYTIEIVEPLGVQAAQRLKTLGYNTVQVRLGDGYYGREDYPLGIQERLLWHHFACMIISLALPGYGASGAMLAVAQGAVRRRFAPLFCVAAAAFGVGAIGSCVLAQRVPFNPLEILWDPHQPAYLLAVYLLLALPSPRGESNMRAHIAATAAVSVLVAIGARSASPADFAAGRPASANSNEAMCECAAV